MAIIFHTVEAISVPLLVPGFTAGKISQAPLG